MSYESLIAHIINDGDNKASDIMAKARENADAMKGRIASELKTRREKAYRELEKEITGIRIKELNAARLKAGAILAEARGDVIADVFRGCESCLQAIIEDSSYPVILLQLLIEGLQHIEGRVEIYVNSSDENLVRSFLKNKDINIEHCDVIAVIGNDRIKGGVEIVSEDKSVFLINTVWSRFEKVKADVIPEIGEILFG